MPGIIGMHQFRYPKEDNVKWRPDARQDIFTQPRYFLWKPHIPQVYSNPKTPLVPAGMAINFNRYGLPPMPSGLHHPNYMFAMPTTKVNNYPYRTIKDLSTKSNPGNFHHITIINAILPKPYLPLPTMSFQSGQQALRSHRNNKQLFYYPMNTGRPTANASRSRISPHQQRPLAQYNHFLETMSSSVQPTSGHQSTNTFLSTNGQNGNQNSINGEAGVGSIQCGQSTSASYSQIETNASNYYCKMLNFYENMTNKRETLQQQVLPNPTSATTTVMNEKSSRVDLGGYTSPKTIFLPTIIYEPHVNYSAETTTKHSNKVVETILRTTTTAPSLNRSATHEHNFFTIEDAITSAPPRNYVFNNPHEALSHARKRKELHSKQKIPKDSGVRTEKNSLFINFFDEKTDTTSEVQDFNRSRFYSPAPHLSYINEGIDMNHNSMISSNNQFADPHGYKRNTDGRWLHLHTTPFSHMRSDKTTTTTELNLYGNFIGKTTTSSEIGKTTPAPTSTTEHEENKTEAAATQSVSEIPIVTTTASPSTTTKSKVKKSRLKHPFYGRSTPAYKSHKASSALLTALKNSTYPSTTASSKKKSHKYQRQYKPKKVKLLKPVLQTTSSPSTIAQSMASTTVATTTKEAHITNKISSRTVTGSSPTEAAATKATKTHSERLLANQPRDSQRLKNSKRIAKGRNGTTTKPRSSKNRRRVYTSSTTAKSHSTPFESVTYPNSPQTSLPSYTATTMKSTTRKSSSESKVKLHNPKTSTKTTPNEVNDYSSAGSKQSSRTAKPPPTRDGGIPPLPIEIYFKNSQNTHI